MVVTKLCAFWCCGCCVGLVVDFQWPVNNSLRKGVFEVEGGADLGVVWSLPVWLPAH